MSRALPTVLPPAVYPVPALARLGAAPGCGDLGSTRLDIPDCTGPSAKMPPIPGSQN